MEGETLVGVQSHFMEEIVLKNEKRNILDIDK
jgi:hypothetical protein